MTKLGIRNYLIAGVAGTSSATVAGELLRRGHHVVFGDREFGYFGNPETGEALTMPDNLTDAGVMVWGQKHWMWRIADVKALAADQSHPVTFFCGDPANAGQFVELFDQVFGSDASADQILAKCGLT